MLLLTPPNAPAKARPPQHLHGLPPGAGQPAQLCGGWLPRHQREPASWWWPSHRRRGPATQLATMAIRRYQHQHQAGEYDHGCMVGFSARQGGGCPVKTSPPSARHIPSWSLGGQPSPRDASTLSAAPPPLQGSGSTSCNTPIDSPSLFSLFPGLNIINPFSLIDALFTPPPSPTCADSPAFLFPNFFR